MSNERAMFPLYFDSNLNVHEINGTRALIVFQRRPHDGLKTAEKKNVTRMAVRVWYTYFITLSCKNYATQQQTDNTDRKRKVESRC